MANRSSILGLTCIAASLMDMLVVILAFRPFLGVLPQRALEWAVIRYFAGDDVLNPVQSVAAVTLVPHFALAVVGMTGPSLPAKPRMVLATMLGLTHGSTVYAGIKMAVMKTDKTVYDPTTLCACMGMFLTIFGLAANSDFGQSVGWVFAPDINGQRDELKKRVGEALEEVRQENPLLPAGAEKLIKEKYAEAMLGSDSIARLNLD